MNLHTVWLLWAYGGHLAAIICCTWAFWRGGTTERLGAAIVAVGWFLSALMTSRLKQGPGTFVVAIDIVMLVLFIILAIWSRKIWVFFIAACMLNSVVSHFTERLIHFGIYSYVTAVGLWGGYGLLICLAFGVRGHIQQEKRRRQLAAGTEAGHPS